ncbi:hypothetical protein RvY_06924 [Ramazzottius varieornatus]|uniref:Uncharacterized protein n=1 Tax=Ramazzottius varieornatus TaxID=947166 RepID=A0A1D1V9V1_RAMVA|nr:hypothetical protein RvY_06924 [Ramazzottius varieornatus]
MKNAVMKILREFKVAHRIFGVTTDGTLNMVKFFELLVTEMELGAPIVNKVTEDATKEKVVTVDRIRACVIYVRRPTIRESSLATIKPATEDLKLPLDVPTRWNSLLHMVKSAYARRHELHDYLSAQKGAIKDEVPSGEEWIDMEDLIELLKPLEAVSVDCSAFKSSTFHLASAELEFLRAHFKVFEEDLTKALWIRELAKDMLVKLDECLRLSCKKPSVGIQVPMIARLLDPSIKDAYLPSVESRSAAGTMLKHIVQLYKVVSRQVPQRGSPDIAEKSTAPPPNTQLSTSERTIAQVTSAADSQLSEVDQFFLDPKE